MPDMGYCTRRDLEDRYGPDELAQREDALGPGAVDRAIGDATAEIESYLNNRYQVPVAPVPGVLVRVCCDMARYRLLGITTTEEARDCYRDAVKWLASVQAGNTNLDGVAAKVGGAASMRVEIIPGRSDFRRSILG